MASCYSLLEFEPSADVSWQSGGNDRPSVDEMIESICQYMVRWEKLKSRNQFSQKLINEFTATFLLKTCEQEDVGITDFDEIARITNEIGRHGDAVEIPGCQSYVETKNLYRAYKKLQRLRTFDPASDEMQDYEITKGLLEIDACVVEIHKCLMSGLPMKTPAGQFSTDMRKTTACGEVHEYPKFDTESEAADAVMRVLDRYNSLYFSLKNKVLKDDDRAKFLKGFFKSAAYLFYNLVSLHPFGDGNGRLCRLVLNFVLESEFPFPIPLSDIMQSNSRDVYIDAVVSPRKSDGFPSQLATLIVESAYHCCRKFTEEMEKNLKMQEAGCSLQWQNSSLYSEDICRSDEPLSPRSCREVIEQLSEYCIQCFRQFQVHISLNVKMIRFGYLLKDFA